MASAPIVSDFRDVAAERVMMAGLAQYGSDVYIEVDGLVKSEMISDEIWREMYVAIGHYFDENINRKLDYHSLIATGKKLGLTFVSNPETKERWRALVNYPIERETAGRESAKIFRLAVMKDLDGELARIRRNIHDNADRDPTLSEILGMAENPIFDFTSKINVGETGPVHIAKGGREWLEAVASEPRENVGIPSPFGRFNSMIGGGFRRKTVSFFAARRGHGKTIMCDNICIHVAKMQIPVLNIDTEMTLEEHRARLLAYLTGIDSNRIERGQLDAGELDACRRAFDDLEAIPYHYHCIESESFDDQLASLRRWAIKKVGVDGGGRRKDCLVVYDWLQMEDPRTSGYGDNYQEYQTLFFQTGALKEMASRCDLPIVAMGQLNREGGIAGSDRITFKVASYTTMHRKDADELLDEPEYQLKLVIDKARHGPGSLPGDYINVKFDGATARMQEGPTRYELERQRRQRKAEFEVEGGEIGELDFAAPEAAGRDQVPRQRRAQRAVQPRRRKD